MIEKVNSFVPPRNGVIDDMDCNDHNWYQVVWTFFFDGELLDQIVYMTNSYAVEQSAVGWNSTDNSTLCAFIGILILSGYNQLPSYKMYLGGSFGCTTTISSWCYAMKPISTNS